MDLLEELLVRLRLAPRFVFGLAIDRRRACVGEFFRKLRIIGPLIRRAVGARSSVTLGLDQLIQRRGTARRVNAAQRPGGRGADQNLFRSPWHPPA